MPTRAKFSAMPDAIANNINTVTIFAAPCQNDATPIR